MIRGTTPNLVLKFKVSVDFIKKITISFKQEDNIVLEKKENDVQFEENKVNVYLTQEETLLFDSNKLLQIQAKVLTVMGDVLATKVYRIPVSDIFNEEIF